VRQGLDLRHVLLFAQAVVPAMRAWICLLGYIYGAFTTAG